MNIAYAAQVSAILRQAGDMIRNHMFSDVREKGDQTNLVTDMDVTVQKFLIEKLSEILPGSGFLAEEDDVHEETDGFLWVIDPIDGTTNYIYDYRHSAISVALLEHHEAVFGAVYDPYLDEMFIAAKGQGAYRNDERIHVSQRELASSLIMCGTTPYEKEFAQETFDIMRRMFLAGKDIRRSGSAVLDLCYVACGRVDGFYEQRLSPWDYAAGVLLILEAGGKIVTLDGDMQYAKRIGLIAGNAANVEDLAAVAGRKPEHILQAGIAQVQKKAQTVSASDLDAALESMLNDMAQEQEDEE
ncbi:MAG: inositol monophosphatase [Erysipelotrichaceae bacterium]|jgi:myo-inositol-1(or 4)-monophosphatase|nr:inositol monophosphatase [Erysipelotrichaceae bacterium]